MTAPAVAGELVLLHAGLLDDCFWYSSLISRLCLAFVTEISPDLLAFKFAVVSIGCGALAFFTDCRRDLRLACALVSFRVFSRRNIQKVFLCHAFISVNV